MPALRPGLAGATELGGRGAENLRWACPLAISPPRRQSLRVRGGMDDDRTPTRDPRDGYPDGDSCTGKKSAWIKDPAS